MSAHNSTIEVGDNLNPPRELLQPELFKNLLKKSGELENVEIRNISFKPACAAGENYSSDMYRVSVRYGITGDGEIREKRFVVKNVQKEDDFELLRELKIFERESLAYNEVLPEMERLLGEKFAASCLHTSPTSKCLILEDLKPLGYEMADRVAGLDRKQSELVLRKIAQFHALSMVVAEKNPQLMESFKQSEFTAKDCPMKDFIFKQNLDFIADWVQPWTGFEQIAEKIRAVKGVLYERSRECLKARDGQLRVLNHGDLWVNNILFLNQTDLAFVDFQMVFHASPGFDIHNLFYTSVQLEVLQKHRYELLIAYYESLTSTLRQLQFSRIPTWDELKTEVRETEFIGFWFLESFYAMTVKERGAATEMDLGSFNDEARMEALRRATFDTEKVKAMFRYCLMRFDELGVLDGREKN